MGAESDGNLCDAQDSGKEVALERAALLAWAPCSYWRQCGALNDPLRHAVTTSTLLRAMPRGDSDDRRLCAEAAA